MVGAHDASAELGLDPSGVGLTETDQAELALLRQRFNLLATRHKQGSLSWWGRSSRIRVAISSTFLLDGLALRPESR